MNLTNQRLQARTADLEGSSEEGDIRQGRLSLRPLGLTGKDFSNQELKIKY